MQPTTYLQQMLKIALAHLEAHQEDAKHRTPEAVLEVLREAADEDFGPPATVKLAQ
jgi:hypothetical protein